MVAWGSTDFRDGLARVSVPTLVIHGDAGASVPFDVQEFDETLLGFLAA
jgi:non-heme chloroperoxidase